MDQKESKIWDLTPKQQESWDNLVKAFKQCKKTGVKIQNHYGSLLAFNSKYISGISDSLRSNYSVDSTIEIEDTSYINRFWSSDLVSLADDRYHVELTEKGKEEYKKDCI